MTTVTLTMVNSTNEELLLDSVTQSPPGPARTDPPDRVGPHDSGQFRMSGCLNFLIGGDADRSIYVQADGAVWAPPTCVIRSAVGASGLEVQVSPAPWAHTNGRPGRGVRWARQVRAATGWGGASGRVNVLD
ncbi:hypothetical protein [Rhodococcus kronopolitis]|uniref:Uncharacterized protein n=1 Tax=Rhodococcus kronopolitis TaxID=1460226 RepID=A0ABV9FSX9_9NOCA